MRATKKIYSVVLALILCLSLGVNVFANTGGPGINVIVANSRSGQTASWTIPATAGSSVKDAIVADRTRNKSWTDVSDYYNPSVTHNALDSYGGFASAKFDKNYAGDVANLIAHSEYSADDIDNITWYTGAYQGYGLIDYDESTGKYTYIYAGYDWTYSSDLQSQIWDYMCCYNVRAGEVIQLVYDFTVTEWTTSDPIM